MPITPFNITWEAPTVLNPMENPQKFMQEQIKNRFAKQAFQLDLLGRYAQNPETAINEYVDSVKLLMGPSSGIGQFLFAPKTTSTGLYYAIDQIKVLDEQSKMELYMGMAMGMFNQLFGVFDKHSKIANSMFSDLGAELGMNPWADSTSNFGGAGGSKIKGKKASVPSVPMKSGRKKRSG